MLTQNQDNKSFVMMFKYKRNGDLQKKKISYDNDKIAIWC